MPLKLYISLLSQPSRTLHIFCKSTKIEFQPVYVDLERGETRTGEFKRNVSVFQKVPVLHDDDLRLTESVAILRYLSRKYDIPDYWYPKDPKKQARVDEYLEWHHNNTRASLGTYFYAKCIYPAQTGKTTSPQKLKALETNAIDCLDKIEKIWLSKGPYLAGNKISVADLLAACEIEQVYHLGLDVYKNRPNLEAWMQRVRKETNPFYDEAHAKLKAKLVGKMAAKL